MSRRLIVISAPSGAGKTTLCERLLKDFPVLMLSVSSTTRSPRGSERDGVDYFFLSREEFLRRSEAGRFAEWAEVHGNFYGTSRDAIDEAFTKGRAVLLDIDVQGAESLRRAYPDDTFGVFVSPPSLEELERRLRARGTDSEKSIRRRLANARNEMAKIKVFDRVIVNDDLDRTYTELRSLVSSALAIAPGVVK